MIAALTISLAAAAVLCVLIELILPEGQTKKYIQGIASLLILFVLISPIATLLKTDFNNIFVQTEQSNATSLNDDFLQRISETRAGALAEAIAAELDKTGIADADVKIFGYSQEDGKAQSVIVNLMGSGITSGGNNININEAVYSAVKKYLIIESGGIVIYGVVF